jgi:hypothetical protein
MKRGKAKVTKKKSSNMKGIKIVASVLILVVVLIFLQIFFMGGKTGVIERSFDKNSVAPGEIFEVSLDIRLSEDQKYYLFEESVPEGFVVLDDVANNNKIRIAEIQNAESSVFVYRVEAPSEVGTYVFSGEYGMELVNGTRNIEGEDTIIVR